MDRASAFRGETIEFIRQCLTVNVNPAGEKSPSSTIIKSFAPVGQAVCQSCTPGKYKISKPRFFDDLISLLVGSSEDNTAQGAGILCGDDTP